MNPKKINITGAIGWDFTGETLRGQLEGHTGDVELLINSAGGSIYDGIEIFNDIKRYQRDTGATVRAVYNGFVASAASYLSMAATERVAYDNSVFMLHNASMGVYGDNRVFQYYADDLKRTDNVISKAYANVTGKSTDEIKTLMSAGEENAGTYYYGDEIVEAGFADTLVDSGQDVDKENGTKESKMLFAKFQKEVKVKEYDHEKIVALVEDFENLSREARDKGAEMKKEEILKGLSNLKENNMVTLPELAEHLGLKDLLITDDQKANLSVLGKVKSLCGDSDPVEFVDGLLKERKENADKVRQAKMTEEFGPEKHPETGKENKVRIYAERVLNSAELSDEKIAELKDDVIFKSLKAEQADVNSEWNRLEKEDNVTADKAVGKSNVASAIV